MKTSGKRIILLSGKNIWHLFSNFWAISLSLPFFTLIRASLYLFFNFGMPKGYSLLYLRLAFMYIKYTFPKSVIGETALASFCLVSLKALSRSNILWKRWPYCSSWWFHAFLVAEFFRAAENAILWTAPLLSFKVITFESNVPTDAMVARIPQKCFPGSRHQDLTSAR